MDKGVMLDRRRLLAAGGAAATLAASGRKAHAQARTITVGVFAGVVGNTVNDKAVPDFTAANPGTTVRVTTRAAAEAYPRMLVSRSSPIENGGMWNDTFAALGAKADLFMQPDAANIPSLAKVPRPLMPKHPFGIPVAVQPYGIAYNPDLVEKPKSWLDLFNPKYVGKVCMHENFWDQYVMLAKILGKDEYNFSVAIDEWAKHKQNIGVWTNSFTRLEELVDKGEMWLGPQWGGFTEGARKRGLKIAFAWPEEGCTQQTIQACVTKGGPADLSQATQRFFEYWLQPNFQTGLLTQLGLSPTNPDVPIPPEYAALEGVIDPKKPTKPLFQYDFAYVGENLPRIRREIDQKLR